MSKSKSRSSKKTTDSKKPVKISNKISKKQIKSKIQEKDSWESEITEEIYVPKEIIKKTSPYMSVYEYTALISARAAIISNSGDSPKVHISTEEDYDPINIATKEVQQHLVTLIIRRKFPDGTSEDWKPSSMFFPRI
jgi:DNA-directed RNA polymerase subunit K/omega